MEASTGRKCCRFLGLQFHYPKLWLFHHNWKAFTYTPFLPYDWRFQAIYLIYRWILALYFFGWIIASWTLTDGPEYLTFLTNWAFIVYNVYLLVAAVSTTISYLSIHFICKQNDQDFSRDDEFVIKKWSGCCGYKDNKLKWYQIVHWVFFTVSLECAVVVMILYWGLLYRGGPVSGLSANTHLMNGIIAIIDFWVSGIPVNFFHFIYPLGFGIVYIVFTGIYFASSGNIVYDVIDYEGAAGISVVVLLGALILLCLVHLLFFFMYMGKVWMLYCCFARGVSQKEGLDEDNSATYS